MAKGRTIKEIEEKALTLLYNYNQKLRKTIFSRKININTSDLTEKLKNLFENQYIALKKISNYEHYIELTEKGLKHYLSFFLNINPSPKYNC